MYYHIFPYLREILQGDMVGKLRKGIRSKHFLNRECICSSTTKVKVTCYYGGDCRVCCVVYKVMCKIFLSMYVAKYSKHPPKRMEQHSEDAAQKVQHDKIWILLRIILLNIPIKTDPITV